MFAGTPYSTLRDAVFVHPTMTEGLNFLFEGMPSASKDVEVPEYAGTATYRK